MKTLINITKLSSLALCYLIAFTSCAGVDVMVDKSQLKAETATHAIYPSSAVTPALDATLINKLIQDQVNKANDSLKEATK